MLYETLEAETGQATGFRRCGSISVARTAERLIELKRGASVARCFGVDIEVISPGEAGRLWPLMRTDDLAGAVWIPRDGRTNPIDTTLARGTRLGGVTTVTPPSTSTSSPSSWSACRASCWCCTTPPALSPPH